MDDLLKAFRKLIADGKEIWRFAGKIRNPEPINSSIAARLAAEQAKAEDYREDQLVAGVKEGAECYLARLKAEGKLPPDQSDSSRTGSLEDRQEELREDRLSEGIRRGVEARKADLRAKGKESPPQSNPPDHPIIGEFTPEELERILGKPTPPEGPPRAYLYVMPPKELRDTLRNSSNQTREAQQEEYREDQLLAGVERALARKRAREALQGKEPPEQSKEKIIRPFTPEQEAEFKAIPRLPPEPEDQDGLVDIWARIRPQPPEPPTRE